MLTAVGVGVGVVARLPVAPEPEAPAPEPATSDARVMVFFPILHQEVNLTLIKALAMTVGRPTLALLDVHLRIRGIGCIA